MTIQEAIKYLKQLYPNGGCCWLDEQRIEAISMAVAALENERNGYLAALADVEEEIDMCTISGYQFPILHLRKWIDKQKGKEK